MADGERVLAHEASRLWLLSFGITPRTAIETDAQRHGIDTSMRLDIYIHQVADEAKLDEILRLVRGTKKETDQMSSRFADLVAAVKENADVEASAVQAIQGLIAKLDAAQGDPLELANAIADLKTSAASLAAAIPVNTAPPAPPADPAPVADPPVDPTT